MAQWMLIIHCCTTSDLRTRQLKMAQIIYYLTRFLECLMSLQSKRQLRVQTSECLGSASKTAHSTRLVVDGWLAVRKPQFLAT